MSVVEPVVAYSTEPRPKRIFVSKHARSTPSAYLLVGARSIAEATVWPIMPDALLVPLAFARPRDWWRLVLASAVGTALGGALTPSVKEVTQAPMADALQWLIPGQVVYEQFAYNNVFATPQYGVFEPWRMLTAAFLHSPDSLLHIILNMYTLWIFGQALEPLLGRARFLALYLISAVGGSVGYLLLNPVLVPGQGLVGVVGASGAIFGLFGAMLLVQRHRGGETRQLWVLIAINGVIGFLIPQIAWQAHLGGLITGGLCAAVLAYVPRGPRQRLLQAAGLAGVLLLLIAVSWLKISL